MGALPRHKLVFVENLDFGYCPVGERTVKSVQMTNHGLHPSYFIWNTVEDSPYIVTVSSVKGVLQPGESTNVTIEFQPEVHGFLRGIQAVPRLITPFHQTRMHRSMNLVLYAPLVIEINGISRG